MLSKALFITALALGATSVVAAPTNAGTPTNGSPILVPTWEGGSPTPDSDGSVGQLDKRYTVSPCIMKGRITCNGVCLPKGDKCCYWGNTGGLYSYFGCPTDSKCDGVDENGYGRCLWGVPM